MAGKIYFIVLDGGADSPIGALGGRTPFEFADTPGLDTIARDGALSYIDVIGGGVCPESDSGLMALLSYDPFLYYTGRGPLEGLGLDMMDGVKSYAAFRVNYASYNHETGELDRRTARDLTEGELRELSDSINRDVDISDFHDSGFTLHSFARHRGILALHSDGVEMSGRITNTDPGYEQVGQFGTPVKSFDPKPLVSVPLADTPEARRTAELLNIFIERANSVLRTHPVNLKRAMSGKLPANCLLARDGGDRPKPLPSFYGKFGLSLSMYGQLPAEKGLAKLIGADFHFTGGYGREGDREFLRGIAERLKRDESDMAYIHLKGPDEPGHDNRPREKALAIELIDRHFISYLLDDFDRGRDIIIASCDHATPCEVGMHSADRVPLAIMGRNITPDEQSGFSERSAERGGLRVAKGIETMPYVAAAFKQE